MVKKDIVTAKLIDEILNNDFNNLPLDPVVMRIKRRILARFPKNMRDTVTYCKLKTDIGGEPRINFREIPKPHILKRK